MPTRVLALSRGFVLLWSGFSTIEAAHVFAQPSPEQKHAIVHDSGQAAAHEGSVEHHQLDELSSQLQNDPLAESLDLLPSPLVSGTPSLAAVRPRVPPMVAVGSPSLAVPLRPPSGLNRIG